MGHWAHVAKKQNSSDNNWSCSFVYLFVIIHFKVCSKNYEKPLIVLLCLSVLLYVRMEQFDFYWTEFHEIWYLSIFRHSVKKIQVSLTSRKDKGYFTWRPIYCTFMIISRSVLLRMIRVSDKSCTENQNTSCVQELFLRSCRFWDSVEKYCRAWQTTVENMTYGHCILDI